MNILVAVTGSIAAYKTPDICRGFVNKGHKVRVICSAGSIEFINPNVFKYLGVEETYLSTDDFKHKNVLHIDLSKWLDTFVLVPATANTISKLSRGECNDLLSSVFLSLEPQKVKVLYPAMNTFMYQNPITQSNINVLKSIPNLFVVTPDSGVLACGDEGSGKLPDVKSIIEMTPAFSNKKVNKKVLITGGATISSIDTVRYVTNPARGGTSYLIAKKYLSEGYSVHMIRGVDVIDSFNHLKRHLNYTEETVATTRDLLRAVQTKEYDIYISPMAVSDIEFESSDKKLKKSSLNGSFKFNEAPDVLKYIVENKKPGQQIVGFAAESTLEASVIEEKMTRKPVDLLVANIADSGFKGNKKGFGTTHGTYKIVTLNKSIENYENLNKEDLADIIFNKIR